MAEKKAPPVVVGGALKLKGAPAGVHKAKKPETALNSKAVAGSVAGSMATLPTGAPIKRAIEKTPAELAHEEVMRKRQEERLKKIASKPHKEKVAEFNRYLENLSEHHDIPRVGPG